MINLLEETEKALKNHGLSLSNVKYIKNKEGYIPIADFVEKAKNINYNNNVNEVYIDTSLKIVGTFWWFERRRIETEEQWYFCKKPKKPTLPAINFSLVINKKNNKGGSDD